MLVEANDEFKLRSSCGALIFLLAGGSFSLLKLSLLTLIVSLSSMSHWSLVLASSLGPAKDVLDGGAEAIDSCLIKSLRLLLDCSGAAEMGFPSSSMLSEYCLV